MSFRQFIVELIGTGTTLCSKVPFVFEWTVFVCTYHACLLSYINRVGPVQLSAWYPTQGTGKQKQKECMTAHHKPSKIKVNALAASKEYQSI
jgi:hypothetical protein